MHATRRRIKVSPIVEQLESRDLLSAGPAWATFNQDAQHSGIGPTRADSLDVIAWRHTVDVNGGGEFYFEHYGSPAITAANTVVIPVKTDSNSYRLDARRGSDGATLWTQSSDYIKLPQSEVYFSAALTPTNRLYYPGPGGTVYFCDNPDQRGATVTGQLAFYGIGNYDPSLDSKIYITTPITSDSAGNIYFGFIVDGSNALNLSNGIARMNPDGTGAWISATRAAKTSAFSFVFHNGAPALSPDESTLYAPIRSGTVSRIVSINSASLRPLNRAVLIDPDTGNNAYTSNASSAVPTVGPDGDVYYGVTGFGSKGWMLHFSPDLQQLKTPGAFGWDNTASIVPRDMVPSYAGPSQYLITTKYNDYLDENYRVAVLDPNVTMVDPYTGTIVMNEVLTIDSPSPLEWCVNASAVDRATKSILINNADGKLYRWDLTTNTFSETIQLADGYFEAYTPTLVGADGTVYAINKAALYAVQEVAPIPGDSGAQFDLSIIGWTRAPDVAASADGPVRPQLTRPAIDSTARLDEGVLRSDQLAKPRPLRAGTDLPPSGEFWELFVVQDYPIAADVAG